MYAIEKNVPIPEASSTPVYPFASMQVGDSFAVPVSAENKSIIRNRLWGATAHYTRKTGVRFSIRTLPGLVRIWRVS